MFVAPISFLMEGLPTSSVSRATAGLARSAAASRRKSRVACNGGGGQLPRLPGLFHAAPVLEDASEVAWVNFAAGMRGHGGQGIVTDCEVLREQGRRRRPMLRRGGLLVGGAGRGRARRVAMPGTATPRPTASGLCEQLLYQVSGAEYPRWGIPFAPPGGMTPPKRAGPHFSAPPEPPSGGFESSSGHQRTEGDRSG